jgi:hypothetical protein
LLKAKAGIAGLLVFAFVRAASAEALDFHAAGKKTRG